MVGWHAVRRCWRGNGAPLNPLTTAAHGAPRGRRGERPAAATMRSAYPSVTIQSVTPASGSATVRLARLAARHKAFVIGACRSATAPSGGAPLLPAVVAGWMDICVAVSGFLTGYEAQIAAHPTPRP